MPAGRAKSFFDQYTSDLKPADLERLFTRDTAEAYRYFTRHVDTTRAGRARRGTAAGRSNCGSCSSRSRCGCRRRGARSTACRSATSLLGADPAVPRLRPREAAALPVHRPPAAAALGGRHAVAGRSAFVGAQSADPDGGRRPAVAQRRPRDRARHPAGDAAGRDARPRATPSCAA